MLYLYSISVNMIFIIFNYVSYWLRILSDLYYCIITYCLVFSLVRKCQTIIKLYFVIFLVHKKPCHVNMYDGQWKVQGESTNVGGLFFWYLHMFLQMSFHCCIWNEKLKLDSISLQFWNWSVSSHLQLNAT